MALTRLRTEKYKTIVVENWQKSTFAAERLKI